MKRLWKEGIQQLWRNKHVTVTTVLLGAVILFLLNILFGVQFLVDRMIQDFEKRADFSVPLVQDYDAFSLESLLQEFTLFPETQVEILEQQNFESFSVPKRLYVSFDQLEDVEPVLFKLKNTRYAALFDEWDGVLEAEFQGVVTQLLQLKILLHKFSLGLMLLFVFAGVVLVYNSFQMLAFMRRNEIGIARMVGAEDRFILGPFIFEGIGIGLISSVVSFLFFVLFLTTLQFFDAGAIFVYLFDNYFFYEFVAALLLGGFGAYWSVNRRLSGSFFKGA